MPSTTIPLAVPDELYEEVRSTAEATHLSMADVVRQSIKAGLPAVRVQYGATDRVTNVDPLPDAVLKRLYAQRDDETPDLNKLMAAQPLHSEE